MRFVVQVRGHNFLVHFDDEPDPRSYGFLTRIDVEADDEAGAEKAAVELLRRTPKLRNMVRNPRDNPPRVFVERMGQYESAPVPPLTIEPSLIWFPEDGTEEAKAES